MGGANTKTHNTWVWMGDENVNILQVRNFHFCQLFVTVISLHRITLIPLLLTLLFSVLAELTGLLLTLSEFLAPFLWLVFAASGIFHDVSSNAHAAILSVFQLRKTGCLTDFFTHTLGPTLLSFPLSPNLWVAQSGWVLHSAGLRR